MKSILIWEGHKYTFIQGSRSRGRFIMIDSNLIFNNYQLYVPLREGKLKVKRNYAMSKQNDIK